MDIKLNKKQMEYLTSRKINTGFVAGLGSGKSYVATLKTIIKKIQNPTLTVAYYLPTYILIRDIAFDKFPTMLSEMGYEYKLNKSDKEIHIKDYGTIIFRSMDNPENIVGYEVFFSIIDECDILNSEKMEIAYNKIMARNRQKHPQGEDNKLDIVGTPEGFKFFYKRFVTEIRPDTDVLIRSSTYENKHLPKQYIKNLEAQYPDELLKAYLYGEFVNLTSGNVYPYFKREIHAKSKEAIKQNETLYIGQDFNIGACISIILVKRGEKYHAVGEVCSYDTRGIVNYFNDNYKYNNKSFFPDASGENRKTSATETDLNILRQAGFGVYKNSSNPRIMDRVITVNNSFEKNMIEINPNLCPNLVKALEQHAYDPKTQLPEKFNTHPATDDYTDSFGYFAHYIFPINQQIQRGNFSTN